MDYHTAGKSSLCISRIGFGCMSLTPDQKEIQHLTDAAIDYGINYFDTADLYDKGQNEINIGKGAFLKSLILPDGKILCAWEDEAQIKFKLI